MEPSREGCYAPPIWGIKGHKAISLNPAYLILTSVGLERLRVQ
ncbi:MAG: hypothetical protein ACP5N5_07005 [Desulfurococcus sp.]